MLAPKPLADLKRDFHAATVARDRAKLIELQRHIAALDPKDYRVSVDVDRMLDEAHNV